MPQQRVPPGQHTPKNSSRRIKTKQRQKKRQGKVSSGQKNRQDKVAKAKKDSGQRGYDQRRERVTKKQEKRKRRQGVIYRQSRLRPLVIPEGSEHSYYDINVGPQGSMRLLYQNVRGLRQGEELRAELSDVKKFQADMILIQETKLNVHDPEFRKKVELVAEQELDMSARAASNQTWRSGRLHQPGGLMTLTRKCLRTKTCGYSDPTSLVQETEMCLDKIPLTILNIYVPLPNTGDTSTWVQTQNTIRELELSDTDANPAEYVYRVIEERVKAASAKKRHVVIGGDFNCEHREGSTMTERMRRLQLANVIADRHRNTPETHKQGCKTIDHVWVSPCLQDLITGYGYLPYDLGMSSDHRGLFVDLRLSRGRYQAVNQNVARKLNSKNVQNVERYLEEANGMAEEHNLFSRMLALTDKEVLTRAERRELNEIDRVLTEILLKAEARLRSLRSQDEACPEMRTLRSLKRYWKKLINLDRRLTDHATLRKLNPDHEHGNILLPRKAMFHELRSIGVKISKLRETGGEKRQQMLERLAARSNRLFKIGKKLVKGSIKSMQNAELARKNHARLRNTKPKRTATVNLVQIPDGGKTVDEMWEDLKEKRRTPADENWLNVVDEEQVEELLIAWCKRHFGQATKTPLAQERWSHILDPRDDNNKIKEILNGEYEATEDEPKEVKEFLTAAIKIRGEDPPFKLSYDDFVSFCHAQEERKASSPSSLHYGHYKALAHDERLLKLKFDVMRVAFEHGFILRRWGLIWEILLRKDADTARIHRFRNITLVEADVQYLMKRIWSRHLMGKTTAKLHSNQNALKNRVTQSSILSHRIALDNMFLVGEKAVIIENDAVNCYDRILTMVAALALLRAGMAMSSVKFMLEFLERAVHRLVLGGKPTVGSYRHSTETQIMGTGQGTGWSPPIWFLVADIIIAALIINQPGLLLTSPTGETIDLRQNEKHVDDSRQGINESGIEAYNAKHGMELTLEEGAKKANQAFERYLTLTGGKLAIDKTMHYSLFPEQRCDRKRYMRAKDTGIHLCLTENFGTVEIPLKRFEANQSHKLLGVHTDPAGQGTDQVLSMMRHTKDWHSRMRISTLSPKLKYLSYMAELRPKLLYPLPAAFLEARDITKIMKPALPSLKHALCLASTVENSIIYIPDIYGGYGIIDVEVEMLAEQARYCVQHLRNDDSLGRRIKILIENHQLESGLNDTILQCPDLGGLEYLTPTLILKLLQRLGELGLILHVDHWRPNNNKPAIMETLRKEVKDKEDLEQINTCRLWLQVHHEVDIRTADSSKILEEYARGQRVRGSRWNWPRWEPSKRAWNKWGAVVNTYLRGRRIQAGRSEHQTPLGYIDKEGSKVMVGNEVYERSTTRREPILRRSEGTPKQHRECDVMKRGANLVLVSVGGVVARPEPQTAYRALTLKQRVKDHEPTLWGITSELPFSDSDVAWTANLLQRGELQTVVCSSYLPGKGTGVSISLVSEDYMGEFKYEFKLREARRGSYTACLTGVCVLLCYFEALIEHEGIELGCAIQIHLTDSSAVRFLERPYLGQTPKSADAPAVEESRLAYLMMNEAKARYEFRYQCKPERVPEEGTIQRQKWAEYVEERRIQARASIPWHEKKGADAKNISRKNIACIMKGGEIVRDNFKRVLQESKYQATVAGLIGIDDEDMKQIDWDAHRRAIKKIASPSLTKLIWGQHATRVRLHQRHECPDNKCPLCGCVDTNDHFLECQVVTDSGQYRSLEQEKVEKARGNRIPDHLIGFTRELMRGRKLSEKRMPQPERGQYIKQKKVGWDNFIRGRVHKSWATVKVRKVNETTPEDYMWRRRLTRTLLEWLHGRWLVRCELMQEKEVTDEFKRELERCDKIWRNRQDMKLLSKDRYLIADGRAPQRKHSLEYLVAWRRTRELAAEEYSRNPEKNPQRRITEFFGVRGGDRVRKGTKIGQGQEAYGL